MSTPSPSRYVCTPLRTQLPALTNREFIRSWMTRRAVVTKTPANSTAVPPAPEIKCPADQPLLRQA